MDINQATKAMVEISKGGDEEIRHCMADDLFCRILKQEGYEEIVRIFNNMVKWYA